MKSFCKTGLVCFLTLGWAAGQANAQATGAPSLLPLPSVTPLDPNAVTASYNAYPTTAEAFGPSFSTTARKVAVPEPPAATPDASPAHSEFDDALHGTCWDDCGCAPSCGRWFGALGGLVMGRNRANPYWTTFETNNNVNQLLNTQNARADWAGGGQVTVGYGFAGGGCGGCTDCGECGSCGCGGLGYLGPGIAFTYWGLGQMNGFAQLTDPNNLLSTPIDLNTQSGPVLIGARPASDFFDNSHQHRIERNDRVNNFELNLLQGAWVLGRLQVAALAGFRYFRFDERLTFGGAASGTNFGDNGGADEAFLSFRCTNNLYGGQLGALLNYNITQRFSVFAIPKAGIYGNQMNCRTLLFTGDGQFGYDIPSHKTDVAFLGELDSGFSYAFSQNWRAFIGYRVVGVANVALADNQFLPFLADTQGFSQVKQNGSLILHGAFFGVGWVF